MNKNISILTLMENSCMRHQFLASHGQSLLITYGENSYLFDVGENYFALKHNLKIARHDINAIKAIAISHKHLDHCGALAELLSDLKTQKIYLLKDVLVEEEKDFQPAEKYRFYAPNKNGKLVISLHAEQIQKIQAYPNAVIVDDAVEIEKGLFFTGPLDGKVKEQAMVINLEDEGIVVIVGCSHPTLPKIIEKAMAITGNQKVKGIIGGFHFKESTDSEFSKYVEYLKDLQPGFIVPSHCTGSNAVTKLKEEMPGIVHVSLTGMLGVGNSIEIKPKLKFNFA